ncbi:MAG: flagellar biosynthesis protein FlhF, partial [Bdellovibrionales bacterium]|nr:flagellar biosynthesis protein FlhF [Bdellovibrionales bacterium]
SKQKYISSSARVQREYIDRVFDNRTPKVMTEDDFEGQVQAATAAVAQAPVIKKKTPTALRYIDISEDEDQDLASASAAQPINQSVAHSAKVVAPYTPAAPTPAPIITASNQNNIQSLQSEIQYLRSMLEKFQNVPQNFVNLHPGADEGIPYELSFAFKKLTDAGVSHQNAASILKIANQTLPNEQKKKKPFVDGWVIKYLLDNVRIVEKPLKSKYHVFVGPTGQGKTSTVVKMACELVMKEKKRIAIISGDHVKVGAADQLKIYSQILNIPCAVISKPQDWLQVERATQGMDHVLLDTPGVNLKNPRDLDTLRSILPANMSGMDVHYVQSIMARDTDAFEIAERFKVIGFRDVIFTRLDEAVQHGLIYNFQKHFDVPLHSFGIGNAIPEDYEMASKERVVDLLFNLSKIRKERG